MICNWVSREAPACQCPFEFQRFQSILSCLCRDFGRCRATAALPINGSAKSSSDFHFSHSSTQVSTWKSPRMKLLQLLFPFYFSLPFLIHDYYLFLFPFSFFFHLISDSHILRSCNQYRSSFIQKARGFPFTSFLQCFCISISLSLSVSSSLNSQQNKYTRT